MSIALAFVAVTALIDGHPGLAPSAWLHAPLRPFTNALPGLLLAALLLAIIRRPLLSALLALGGEGIIYAINALKVKQLGSPLVPADFHMAGQLHGGGVELLSGYLPRSPWPYLGVIAIIGAVIVLAKLERPWFTRRFAWARIGIGAGAALLLATQWSGALAWRHLYDRQRLGMQPWSASATTRDAGLINSLMLFHLQFESAPRRANPEVATRLLVEHERQISARLQSAPIAMDDQPDIVVILSESFFDPAILNGYGNSTQLLPNLHRLAQHGTSGALHVPTFGGGTIRTEFEVLTGLPLRYFGDIQFPYLQIHEKSIPGLVRTLERHGYETLAVHGNDPSFWNRTSAFKALGFQHFVSQGQFPSDDDAHDGKYMSDRAFTDELLRQLPDSGPPRFVLGISIEAHGPYSEDYGIDTAARDAIPVPAGLDGPARTELQNYLYHARHADQQLGRLIDTLAQRKRRTLILFFGDHLPALMPTYQATGFRNDQGFLVQTVPYLMIDTASMQHAQRLDAAAWQLPGMLLERAGIDDDPYFALTQVVGPQLETLTRAPDAPPADENAAQLALDDGMADVATLRLHGKLDALWAQLPRPQSSSIALTIPTLPPATTPAEDRSHLVQKGATPVRPASGR